MLKFSVLQNVPTHLAEASGCLKCDVRWASNHRVIIPVVLEHRLRLDVLSGSDSRLGAALIVCSVTHFHCIVFLLSFLSVAVLWSLEVEVVVSVFVCDLHLLFRVSFGGGGGGDGGSAGSGLASVHGLPYSLVLCLAVWQPPLTRWTQHTVPPRVQFKKSCLQML